MPLRACMEAHTHREYLAWTVWLDEQWNVAEPVHYYLMQLAAEVRRSYVKNNRSVKLDHFKMQFVTDRRQPPTREQAAAWSKAKWLHALGLDRKAPQNAG